ncbi:MAG: hypothetical protein ACLFPQ_01750 [Candidatus Woesearchaeota archaeon]
MVPWSNEIIITAIVLGSFIFIIAGIIIFAVISERKRDEAFKKLSIRQGFHLTLKKYPLEKIEANLDLFTKGYSKKVRRMIEGSYGKMNWKIFDYYYIVGAGKSSSQISTTVFLVGKNDLNLPHFYISHENFLTRVGTVFSGKDIDFENHPIFSDKYYLFGKDESAIKKFFNDSKLKYFENNDFTKMNFSGKKEIKLRNFVIEANGKYAAFYNHSRQIPPEYIYDMMNKCKEIIGFLNK